MRRPKYKWLVYLQSISRVYFVGSPSSSSGCPLTGRGIGRLSWLRGSARAFPLSTLRVVGGLKKIRFGQYLNIWTDLESQSSGDALLWWVRCLLQCVSDQLMGPIQRDVWRAGEWPLVVHAPRNLVCKVLWIVDWSDGMFVEA